MPQYVGPQPKPIHNSPFSFDMHRKSNVLSLSVKDQGMGISAENLETIFQKFSTVPSAGINKPEGTGLGLAICKAIIEAHDGKIWAESVKNESSTFFFSLLKRRPQPHTPDAHTEKK